MIKIILIIAIILNVIIIIRGIHEAVYGCVRFNYLIQSIWWEENVTIPLVIIFISMIVVIYLIN